MLPNQGIPGNPVNQHIQYMKSQDQSQGFLSDTTYSFSGGIFDK